jgi:excisionase family DNA binding protein
MNRLERSAVETVLKWPEYMDPKTVREYCGLSRTSTWRLIKAGELEAVKLGRSVKVRRASLDRYLEAHAYTEKQ